MATERMTAPGEDLRATEVAKISGQVALPLQHIKLENTIIFLSCKNILNQDSIMFTSYSLQFDRHYRIGLSFQLGDARNSFNRGDKI